MPRTVLVLPRSVLEEGDWGCRGAGLFQRPQVCVPWCSSLPRPSRLHVKVFLRGRRSLPGAGTFHGALSSELSLDHSGHPCFRDLCVAVMGGTLVELPRHPPALTLHTHAPILKRKTDISAFVRGEALQVLEANGGRWDAASPARTCQAPPCSTQEAPPSFRHAALPHWGLPGNPGVLALEQRSVSSAQRSSWASSTHPLLTAEAVPWRGIR